ncbi:L-threonylcarbamoyladenylate synthase [uncultured Desulfovibrio sp.]|uniref:L-threonylcarbamoyladenylate synthase n=2 Tax=uncultured Desulfovibrio sp. TaxID=167968 RepID=UPI0025EFF76B|nr:L-threonylcarbamoyladenylate synthase [uncultured Desulfovibrio sp.]
MFASFPSDPASRAVPSPGPRVSADPLEAAAALRAGGVWAFPTETFYGLGCSLFATDAVRRVYQLKRRPVQRPLPVLAGGMEQLAALVRLDEAPRGLLEQFWPGPLTVLLSPLPEAASRLPEQVCGPTGRLAVRLTPHPLTARLSREAGAPLTCSSANLSGQPAARLARELPPELLAPLDGPSDGVLDAGPDPRGGQPSSIVEPLPDGGLRLLRAGAVSAQALRTAGFACRE